MELLEAAALAKLKMLEHKLYDWKFVWNNRKVHLGLCRYGRKSIELSKSYVNLNTVELVLDTILHEIAHALDTSRSHHGPQWKQICLNIGARPVRVKANAIMPDTYKHEYKCPKCGYVFKMHRRLSDEKHRWHRTCGRTHLLVKIK